MPLDPFIGHADIKTGRETMRPSEYDACVAWPCQPVERTSLPGRAPVSSPFSKMGVPEQIVMS